MNRESRNRFVSRPTDFERPICNDCKHLIRFSGGKCAAYPAGIPKEILINDVDHTKPYKGDNGIQFEPK